MSNRFFSFVIKHKRTLFALVFVFLFSVTVSYAVPPATKYQPGETLDPGCAPGATNCSVQVYPDVTGHVGQVLTTDGTTLYWATPSAAALPTQTGHAGQFLTTDGTNASWVSLSSLFPSQSGHAGQALITDGAGNLSWGSETFNGNRTVTRSGLPAVNVGTTTIQDFLEKYFFPVIITGPGASLSLASGSTSRELGSSNAVSLNWTATKNTNSITSITLTANNGGSYSSGTPITATGNTQSGSASATTVANTNTTFTLTVSDGTTSPTSNVTISYFNRVYNGVSSVSSGITDGQIQALANSPFATSRTLGSTAYSPSSQYVYFVWPASFDPSGGCNAVDASDGVTPVGTTNCFFQGSTPVTDFLVQTRSFTNASGYTSSYKIYRSANLLSGSISYSVQ